MNIIQFGIGKWGKNHGRILKDLCELEQYDIEYDYKEIIDYSKPDGVIITTDSVNHYPISEYCIINNIPVYVEKPVLLKKNQLAKLKNFAKDNPIYMSGHQVNFFPGLPDSRVTYMSSKRVGAIPRSEGSLFSLMVHDIAMAHYLFDTEFEVLYARGDNHRLDIHLITDDNRIIEMFCSSIDTIKLRSTNFVTDKGIISISPDNWGRFDILETSLKHFLEAIKNKQQTTINNIHFTIKVMETVFKIQNYLNNEI